MKRGTLLFVVCLIAAFCLEIYIQSRHSSASPVQQANDGRLFCGNTTVVQIVNGKWVCWDPNNAKPWWKQ